MVVLERGSALENAPGRGAEARPTPVGESQAGYLVYCVLGLVVRLRVRRQRANTEAGVRGAVCAQSLDDDVIPVALLGVLPAEVAAELHEAPTGDVRDNPGVELFEVLEERQCVLGSGKHDSSGAGGLFREDAAVAVPVEVRLVHVADVSPPRVRGGFVLTNTAGDGVE